MSKVTQAQVTQAHNMSKVTQAQVTQAHKLNALANYALEQEKFSDAIAYSRQAIKIMPDFAEAYLVLGTGLFYKKRVQQASMSYQKALSVNPKLVHSIDDIMSQIYSKVKFVDYSRHPAFSTYARKQVDSVLESETFCKHLSKKLKDIEDKISRKEVNLPNAIDKLIPDFKHLFNTLKTDSCCDVLKFSEFLKSLWIECFRVLVDDLAYFERRNSYEPMIPNQSSLNWFWELKSKGYFSFVLPKNTLETLRDQLKPLMQKIERKAQSGLDSREELSTNQIPREIVEFLHHQFEALGISSAIRGVRREVCTLSGFALELSVPYASWWQSDYAGLGCPTTKCNYFHTDESRDVYKAILYLDDVLKPENGATGYLPFTYQLSRDRLQWIFSRAIHTVDKGIYRDIGSSGRLISSPLFRQHFMCLPDYLQVNSHWGYDLIDELPNSDLIANQEVKLLGESGTCFVFDGGQLVHRGGLVKEGNRWALQIIFGVNKQNASLNRLHIPDFSDI